MIASSNRSSKSHSVVCTWTVTVSGSRNAIYQCYHSIHVPKCILNCNSRIYCLDAINCTNFAAEVILAQRKLFKFGISTIWIELISTVCIWATIIYTIYTRVYFVLCITMYCFFKVMDLVYFILHGEISNHKFICADVFFGQWH